MKTITIVIYGIILLVVIAFFDYFFIGKRLIGEVPLKKKDLLAFYFTRSFAEFLCFFLGIIIGGRFG